MNRYSVVFVASLFVLFGGIVAAGATIQARDLALRGVADPAAETDLPYRIPRFGVNADLTQYDDESLSHQLDLMESAHVYWVRQFFRWDQIAPTPDVLDWSAYDRIVHAVAERPDLNLVAVLFGTPTWARDPRSPADPTTPPAAIEAFSGFARLFAEHYRNSMDVVQIWDEPNLESAWGGLPPQPVDYLAMLSSAYAAVHGINPNTTVIAAALAPTTEDNSRNISDWHYLAALYELGGKDSFDAAAAKPYGFDSAPDDRLVLENRLNFSRIIGLREIMVQHGDGQKLLWASDWGWNSLPPDWIGNPSIWGNVTAQQQAAYTRDALVRANAEWAWMGGMVLHQWQPNAPCDDPQWGFAVVACDDSVTPLYDVLTAQSAPDGAQSGVYFPTSPYARYSGVWTFSQLGADIGWVQDSHLSLRFVGSSISLLVRKDNYSAFLYAMVDGQPANALPHDSSGRAYLTLTSETRTPETRMVPVASHLSGGVHTLDIVADRGWDRWALAGFGVSAGDPSEPYQRQIGVALLTIFVGALACVMSLTRFSWASMFRQLNRPVALLSDGMQIVLSAGASVAVLIGMFLTWNDSLPSIFRREPVQLLIAIASAGIVYLQPHILLLIVGIFVLAFILYHHPQYGLLLTLFYTPFFLFPVELYRFAFPMSELLILLTLATFVLRGFVTWGTVWRSGGRLVLGRLITFNALDLGLLFWLMLGALSLVWANIPGRAITELRTLFIEPVLFYMLARLIVRDQLSLTRLVDALLLAGIVVCLIGLYLYFTGQGVITAEEGAQRLASVYGSPNNVALFLGRCMPFAFAYTLVKVDLRRRLLAGFIVGLTLASILFTQSAGALFLGVPFTIAVVLLLAIGRRALLVILGLALAAAGTIPFAMRSARFQRLLDFSQGTNFFRLRVWESAVNMIADQPLTGIGLDQFLYAYRGTYLRPDAWQEPDLSHPHNFFLDVWLRLGLFGVMLFIWLQVHFWRTAFFHYRRLRQRNPILFALLIGAMGSMVNLLAHGFVDNSIFVNDLSYVFVLLLAIISNIRAIDVQPKTVV